MKSSSGRVSRVARPRGTKLGSLVADDGHAVCATCELADTVLTRLRGLLGRASLSSGEGLLLVPAGSVHTFFMRFAIDVVFLDRDLCVRRIVENVGPSRLVWARSARRVLELPAGEAQRVGLREGAQLAWHGAASTASR